MKVVSSVAHRSPRVLVAAVPNAARTIGRALGDLRYTTAHTFDQAVRQLGQEPPDLVLVGYHFDELMPFRLIHYIREESRSSVPIVLVRTLPLLLGQTSAEQIRTAYKAFGVEEFVSLYDDQQLLGTEPSLQRFRDLVSTLLRDSRKRSQDEC